MQSPKSQVFEFLRNKSSNICHGEVLRIYDTALRYPDASKKNPNNGLENHLVSPM